MIITIVHLRFANRVTGQQLFLPTIFTRIESYNCPVCRSENVELIPLNLDEEYEYQLEPDKGLEIKFSINEEIIDLETED
jgi:hypothetical protein